MFKHEIKQKLKTKNQILREVMLCKHTLKKNKIVS